MLAPGKVAAFPCARVTAAKLARCAPPKKASFPRDLVPLLTTTTTTTITTTTTYALHSP